MKPQTPEKICQYAIIGLAALLCSSCIPPRTTVQIIDEKARPIEGFPFRFKLDEGMTQTNFLTPVSQHLKTIDSKTFEGTTDANGEIGISYNFNKRQPADWRILIFGAKTIPNQHILITPLKSIPKGTSIKVGIPNP